MPDSNKVQIEVSLLSALLTSIAAVVLILLGIHVYFNWQFHRVIEDIAAMRRTQAAYHGIEMKAITDEESSSRANTSTR